MVGMYWETALIGSQGWLLCVHACNKLSSACMARVKMQVFWRDSISNESCFYTVTLNCIQLDYHKIKEEWQRTSCFLTWCLFYGLQYFSARVERIGPVLIKICWILAHFNEPIPGVMIEQGMLGKKWRGEIDHPWERGCHFQVSMTRNLCQH